MRRRILPFLVILVLALAAGCQSTPQSRSETSGEQPGAETRASAPQSASSDEPLSWGPTQAELEEARELVAGWEPAQLAGQVIVGRYYGTRSEERRVGNESE